MQELPKDIARTQWNNRIKTVLLSSVFLLGIAVFSFCMFLMIFAPISLVPGNSMNLLNALSDPKTQIRLVRFFFKILFFSLAGSLYFIYRDIHNISTLFMADRLSLKTTDDFYRTLEQKCIERGLKTPELYLFTRSALPETAITAAVVQGVGGKSALILTKADLALPPPQREALAAQVVQRLHTRDTWFLTLFCFLGHFPFHVMQATNKFGRYVFWLPMKIADLVIAPFRPMILDLRMARLDMGALEMTKDAQAMSDLVKKLATQEEVEKYFYTPYLSLFIAAGGKTREEALTTS